MNNLTALQKEENKISSIKFLKKLLKRGDTVYTVVTKVAPSGMSRDMKVFIVDHNKVFNITSHVADIEGYKYTDKNAIHVSGCGMDMGFHVVYSLSYTLFKNGKKQEDQGYYLKQQWL